MMYLHNCIHCAEIKVPFRDMLCKDCADTERDRFEASKNQPEAPANDRETLPMGMFGLGLGF